DYHESGDATPTETEYGAYGSVLITTPNVHLRGMDRNGVVVDGTKAGSAKCASDEASQNFGAPDSKGKPLGRNGIVVWKADNVSIENLTTCNFMAGSGSAGNGVWWNGGDDSGKIGMKGYSGSYLSATSTYFGSTDTAAQYGIFSSNTQGPGSWDQIYASNMDDSGMYVGACLQVCDMTIDHAWMQYSALGYSGTNSGGTLIIENSQFDHNKDGVDTNTQIAGDPPAPQNGACPDNGISPITHTHSCWVFMHNNVHDNNNPNVPNSGTAGQGPTGTGMTVSGGRNDTVMDNHFSNNGAWGILFVPYPDSGTPDPGQTCASVGGFQMQGFGCVLEPEGNALLHNIFAHNGFFGNPSNSDFGQIVINAGKPRNCYSGNTAPNGSAPADLEKTQPTCGPPAQANSGGPLLAQVLCDTGNGTCPAGAKYPKLTGVIMQPLPSGLPSMPNPCEGVPSNAWCVDGKPV
ncbi:MAG TPA: hypothetical protein VMT43_09705, partial [Acidimicrobiales bacterium]|nr:hypothetical protein [Acidimicrobiales bacterium]